MDNIPVIVKCNEKGIFVQVRQRISGTPFLVHLLHVEAVPARDTEGRFSVSNGLRPTCQSIVINVSLSD